MQAPGPNAHQRFVQCYARQSAPEETRKRGDRGLRRFSLRYPAIFDRREPLTVRACIAELPGLGQPAIDADGRFGMHCLNAGCNDAETHPSSGGSAGAYARQRGVPCNMRPLQ